MHQLPPVTLAAQIFFESLQSPFLGSNLDPINPAFLKSGFLNIL